MDFSGLRRGVVLTLRLVFLTGKAHDILWKPMSEIYTFPQTVQNIAFCTLLFP